MLRQRRRRIFCLTDKNVHRQQKNRLSILPTLHIMNQGLTAIYYFRQQNYRRREYFRQLNYFVGKNIFVNGAKKVLRQKCSGQQFKTAEILSQNL